MIGIDDMNMPTPVKFFKIEKTLAVHAKTMPEPEAGSGFGTGMCSDWENCAEIFLHAWRFRHVEYIPNCPLQGTGFLSGRGSHPQELGHIEPRGNIQGEFGNARSLRLGNTPLLSILADRSHVS